MHTKVVYQGAKALTRIGCVVLRFNFRGVGASGGTFDQGPGELADFHAAVDYLRAEVPDVPVWAAGFSFGAWVALEGGAVDDRVSVLIGISPPVAREGYTFRHVLASAKPTFLVQGDRDEICALSDTRAFYGKLPEPKDLVVVEGGSHLFDGRTLEVGAALEDLLGDFAP
jgi:alpha/beta superfamily hydrolase